MQDGFGTRLRWGRGVRVDLSRIRRSCALYTVGDFSAGGPSMQRGGTVFRKRSGLLLHAVCAATCAAFSVNDRAIAQKKDKAKIKVDFTKRLLELYGIAPERIEMFHNVYIEGLDFVNEAKAMTEIVEKLGPFQRKIIE